MVQPENPDHSSQPHDDVANEEAHVEHTFARAYFSRATPVTYAILGLNLAIHVFMTSTAGGDFIQQFIFGVDSQTLIAFGAKTNELLLQRGEWFRLVTPVFVHAGLIHIVSNSYALWLVGPQVERLYGSARFVLAYLLCGIGGVAGSYLSSAVLGRDPTVPSVGASGAIFGLFGMLAVFGYKYRHELPSNFRRAFGSSVFPVIAINLFIGFFVPFIDNGAHIGGLICGALFSVLVPYVAPGKERRSPLGLFILGVCVLIIAFCFVRAAQHSSQHLARRSSVIGSFLEGINEGKTAMSKSFAASQRRDETSETASELDAASEKLKAASAPDAESDRIRKELIDLVREQRSALDEQTSALHSSRLAENADRFRRVNRDLRQWVSKEGKKFGVIESGPSVTPR